MRIFGEFRFHWCFATECFRIGLDWFPRLLHANALCGEGLPHLFLFLPRVKTAEVYGLEPVKGTLGVISKEMSASPTIP